MTNEKVVKVRPELYEKAQDLAKAEGIPMADAISKLVEAGGAGVPTTCQLEQFRNVLLQKNLTPPKEASRLWHVLDLPAELVAKTKLEPYAQARQEAEMRCALGDELYCRMISGELTPEEKVDAEVLAEFSGVRKPVTELEIKPVTKEEEVE